MIVNLPDDFVNELIKLADSLSGNKLKKLLLSRSDLFFSYKTSRTTRINNCLEAVGINRVIDVVNTTEYDLLRIKNLGRVSVREIKRILKEANLSLDMKIKEEDL